VFPVYIINTNQGIFQEENAIFEIIISKMSFNLLANYRFLLKIEGESGDDL
jgi:hypothetical protein